jgi:hypothetical protein
VGKSFTNHFAHQTLFIKDATQFIRNHDGGQLRWPTLLILVIRNDAILLIQKRYLAGGAGLHFEFDAGFFEKAHKLIIGVLPKGHETGYPGIDQHLGAKHTGRMRTIDCSVFQTNAV